VEIWKETITGWGHSGCRHSYEDDARPRDCLGEIHESTRFGNEEPSGLKTELVEAQYVGAWLSLVERPVRDRKVAGSNPVAPTKLTNVALRAISAINPGQKNEAFNKFEELREADASTSSASRSILRFQA
jgi:hypothetical protein